MKKQSFASLCAREIKEIRTTPPHVLPIYATSSFAFESIDQGMEIFKGNATGHVYSRYGNPTMDTVANKLALLEGFDLPDQPSCILFSSGMSAILTLMLSMLEQGDAIVTQANLYGGTTEQFNKILAKQGIEIIYTDLSNLREVASILNGRSNVRMIYGESPANPTLACIDLVALAKLAQSHNVYTCVDNTFCTPYLQRPLSHGIDFVVHSTTKFLNGHGNSTSGALVGRDARLMQEKIWSVMKLGGTNCNPFDAWLLHNGLKTLTLRMDRHCSNALQLAKFLMNLDAVETVNYPGLEEHPDHELAKSQMSGFGGMLSFELRGGLSQGVEVMRNLKMCTLAPTLGDIDTLVLHPASMSHINIDREVRLQNGITDGLIRVSVGIEDISDLKEDFEQAIASSVTS